MNSKNVLKRIVNLLSAEEVKFASAKLVDGTIVESEDFAVGSEVFVVSEDGRELAPDAEHRVIIDDKEFKVVTEGGVITSVEAVEEESEEVEAEEEVKVEEEIEASKEEVEMESDEEKSDEDLEEVIEDEVEEEPLSLEKVYEEMKYRIEELEKKVEEMKEEKEELKEEIKEELEEDEELPVLDGAPVEMSKTTKLGKKASQSYESKFLSRLYN